MTGWKCCEKVNACFDVFARSVSDEAIHSSLRGGMDCFASLAMTVLEASAEG